MRAGWVGLAAALAVLLGPGVAAAGPRFAIEGERLVFDGAVPPSPATDSPAITDLDLRNFATLLRDHPEVSTVVVSGPGGQLDASFQIAELLIASGKSTVARGECASACVVLFLAGATRGLEPGARIGLHRFWTAKAEQRAFFLQNRQAQGWHDMFDYVVWVHEDAQNQTVRTLAFMVDRGVTVDFALQAFSHPAEAMWYPTEPELRAAGVVTSGG